MRCIYTYFLVITAGQGRDTQMHGLGVSNDCKVPSGHRKLILLQAFVLSPLNASKFMHVVSTYNIITITYKNVNSKLCFIYFEMYFNVG